MPTTEILFSGAPSFLGGLSNEEELVKCCPKDFMQRNEWSDYAMQIFFAGGSCKDWKWKFNDEGVRKQQLACFKGLLGTFGIKHEHKEAVAGWMLSEMLTEVPQTPTKQETADKILTRVHIQSKP